MRLGKIVKSNSHTDYICQVYCEGEVAQPPQPEDYSFGTFVRIGLSNQPDAWLAGIIYDTVLLNPEFGRLGPRLSPPSDLAVFSPDYLNEKATLIGIAAIGTMNSEGQSYQGVPPVAAQNDALVEQMTDEEICAFHIGNPSLHIAYIPVLLSGGRPLASHLTCVVLKRLKELFAPPQTVLLDLLLDEMTWQNQVNPFGGNR